MKLSNILHRDKNNIDIFRLYAALMVIFGHAHALFPLSGKDIVSRFLGFDYSGSLAVKIFFFLSGLVVTNSLINKKNIRQYILSRAFRIWPALIVVVALVTFVLSPIITSIPLKDYLSSQETWGYLYHNILLNTRYSLPGVFDGSPHPSANGSLWTIPYEVFAYLFLLIAFFILKFNKIAMSILATLIIIDPIIGNKLIFTWLSGRGSEVYLLPPCFAFGALLALYKDDVTINLRNTLFLIILYLLFRKSSYNFYFFYVSLFIAILYLSSNKFILKIKPPIDVSYGVYLWGWPIQKTIILLFPLMTIGYHQVIASTIAIVMGAASWYLIEKRFIKIGRKFE